MDKIEKNKDIFYRISNLIEQARRKVATAINQEMVLLYWNIGKTIKEKIIKSKRAEYGEKIVQSLTAQLVPRYELFRDIFTKAGFIESWGRGTIKIVENCVKQGLPETDFTEESGVMKVIFYKDKFTEKYLKEIGLNERK
jgi:hypothetical protein